MKTHQCILVCLLAVMLCACDATTREARRMVKRAELLADTLPDSTVRLIDSVLRMPASLSERERMDMALLQAEAQLILANAVGATVAQFSLSGNEGNMLLDLRDLSSGIYTYTITCERLSQTGKLVITK